MSATDSTRYRLIHKIATGGAATVWIGAVRGGLGFRQLVAIKKPHPHLFELPSLRNELITEARHASMIQHGNVVDVRDVDAEGDQINLVMDYIEGGSLAELLRAAKDAGTNIPPKVVVRIILDACAGLHAAHELVGENGESAGLVHRDVSPQNILVGLDGISRVTDFGIAKATHGDHEKTDQNLVKGKLSYMSPEYLTGKGCDRRLDVFALGVVCWEALANERCFKGDSDLDTANRIIRTPARLLSEIVPELGTMFDDVLATAMDRKPDRRFPTMRAFATALEGCAASRIASHADVAATVASLIGTSLEERRAKVRAALADDRASDPLIELPRGDADSKSAEPVALPSTDLVSDASKVIRPSDPSDAIVIPTRRRPLTLMVAGIGALAVTVFVIAMATHTSDAPRANLAAPVERAASTQVAHRPDPIPEPPPPVESAGPAEPTASAAPIVSAPHPVARPALAPAGPVKTGKAVPPNPYRR